MVKVVIIDLPVRIDKSDSYEALRNRQIIQNELNSQEIPKFSFESYSISASDKAILKAAKFHWRNTMRKEIKGFKKKKHQWTHKMSFDRLKELLTNSN